MNKNPRSVSSCSGRLQKVIICIMAALSLLTKSSAQTYTYNYTAGSAAYEATAIFSSAWGETYLELKVKNTGAAAINMSGGKFFYNAPAVAYVNMTQLGGTSWPDRIGHGVIADIPMNINVDTVVLPSGSWVSSNLGVNSTYGYKLNLGSSFNAAYKTAIAQSLRFYAQGWMMPQLNVPVTVNLSGNGGNPVNISIRNTATSVVTQQAISNGATISLRNNSAFEIWADNFTSGTLAYSSVYTSIAPLFISTPAAAPATLSFTSAIIPTATMTVNVTGLPTGSSGSITINSAPGATFPYSKTKSIVNGANTLIYVPAGTYNIQVSKYADEASNVVATPAYSATYTLSATSAAITVRYSPCSMTSSGVAGWPKYLAHGTVTQPAPEMDAGLQATPIDAIFKYSGNDGAGDRGLLYTGNAYLSNAVKGTISQARRLESYYQSNYNLPGFRVMPVMIHYTANASGGGTVGAAPDFLDSANLRIHFRNLIREVKMMLDSQDAAHPYPGTLILSPDLLGALQQDFSSQQWAPPYNYNNPSFFTVNVFKSKIFVNQKLAEAFAQEGFMLPAGTPLFKDSLKGYFGAINYLIHTIGQDKIQFGWQENMWSTGSANWVHGNTTAAVAAQQVVSFLQQYTGVFEGPYKPTFLAIDRYERDCFGGGTSGSYAYNATKWKKTVDYGGYMAKAFGLPLMLWQFPGGHLVPKNTPVSQYDLAGHSSACATYFLGDPAIGTNLNNINSTQLAISIPSGNYAGASTVGALLAQDSGYDWSQSQLSRIAAENNVFAILWGGGSTTSISNIGTNGYDDGWLAAKLKLYYLGGKVYKTDTSVALASTSVTKTIATTGEVLVQGCAIIAKVQPSGASPVSGSVQAAVWIDTALVRDAAGSPYVKRHYDIAPQATTASATLTLYFLASEFANYNASADVVSGAYTSLPASAASNAVANVRIVVLGGQSSTGVWASYSSTPQTITPGAVLWNAIAQRWEVSFPTSGAAGYFLQSALTLNSAQRSAYLSSGSVTGLQAMVFPVPAGDGAHLSLTAADATLNYKVSNLSGQVMAAQENIIVRGSLSMPLSVGSWPAGIYMVTVTNTTTGERLMLKLIK